MAKTFARLVAPLALALTLSGCALAVRRPSVAELKYNPGRYQDERSRSTAWSPARGACRCVPFRLYKVDDGTGEVTVVAQGGRVPTQGRARPGQGPGRAMSRRWAARRSACTSSRPTFDFKALTCSRIALWTLLLDHPPVLGGVREPREILERRPRRGGDRRVAGLLVFEERRHRRRRCTAGPSGTRCPHRPRRHPGSRACSRPSIPGGMPRRIGVVLSFVRISISASWLAFDSPSPR